MACFQIPALLSPSSKTLGSPPFCVPQFLQLENGDNGGNRASLKAPCRGFELMKTKALEQHLAHKSVMEATSLFLSSLSSFFAHTCEMETLPLLLPCSRSHNQCPKLGVNTTGKLPAGPVRDRDRQRHDFSPAHHTARGSNVWSSHEALRGGLGGLSEEVRVSSPPLGP